jgi:hypothetical protein
MRMKRAIGVASVAVGLALVGSTSRGQGEEARVFEQAVESLVAAIRSAEPKVRCEVTAATPAALGWRAEGAGGRDLASRRCVLWTPVGLSRAFGLIARAGARRIEVLPGQRFPLDLAAAGPDLIVVTAPPEEPAALTLEARQAAGLLLERGLGGALDPWRVAVLPAPAAVELGLPPETTVALHAHVLEVTLPEGIHADFERCLAAQPWVFERPARRFHIR